MAQRALAKREETAIVLSPEALISKAIESGISVEGLERLLGMHERLKAAQARESFIDAMAAFQAECPAIPRNRTAKVESKSGGSYTYKYATLDSILKATAAKRAEHGFSHRFDTRFEENPPSQVTVCIVSHRDGHSEQSEFRSPIDSGARMNVMQQSASAQTYSKRYAFLNAFGIVADDDDDGHGAVVRPRQGYGSPEPMSRAAEPSGPEPGERRMPPRSVSSASEAAAQRHDPASLRDVSCPECGKTGTAIGLSSGKIACARGKGGCGHAFDLPVVQGELV